MLPTRTPPTATDYVILVIGPVLVMGMVGSFAAFLVETFYAGDYPGRLLYTLFFFVFAAVLTARISIEAGYHRAGVYAAALGVVTFLALQAYVQHHGGYGVLINLLLLGVIWWSAHKLTWDCTAYDDRGSGRGILAAIGWDGAADASPTDASLADPSSAGSGTAEGSAGPPPAAGTRAASPGRRKRRRRPPGDSRLAAWLEAYRRHREAQRRGPRTPGVWVVYLTLAALPVFALGQSLIDPDDHDRRRAVLVLMVLFIGSALGLLSTTSLLNLRQYLRRRQGTVPPAVTAGWLGFSGLLIAAFLLLALLLPRPHSETPWFDLARAGSREREASPHAVYRDEAGRGPGPAGRTSEYDPHGPPGGKSASPDGPGDARGHTPGSTPNPNSKDATVQPRQGQGQGQGPGQDRGQGSAAGNGKQPDSRSGDGPGQHAGSPAGQGPRNEAKNRPPTGSPPGTTGSSSQERGGTANQGSPDRSAGSSPSGRPSGDMSPPLMGLLGAIGEWVRRIAIALLVIGLVLGGVYLLLRYLAPFTGWARDLLEAWRRWWSRLWGREGPHGGGPDGERTYRPSPPPFVSFADPFADGSAAGRDAVELVDYTFRAMEAWAYEAGVARGVGETAAEFVARLRQYLSDGAEALEGFARLHAQVLYGASPLPLAQLRRGLQRLWQELSAAPPPETVRRKLRASPPELVAANVARHTDEVPSY